MKLYFSPGACSLSPHIVLREAGVTFDLEQVDLKTKKTKGGADFKSVNPKGQVPVLVLDDGRMLTEGPAIVQYLGDQKPALGLVPAAGTFERYRLQEWLNFVTAELHKGFTPLFRPDTPDAYKEIARANLAAKLAVLDAHLAKNQYLMGDNFTVADAYCFVVVGWSKFVGVDLKPFANVGAYLGRIAARPKVQEALKAEGLAA